MPSRLRYAATELALLLAEAVEMLVPIVACKLLGGHKYPLKAQATTHGESLKCPRCDYAVKV